MFTKYGLSSSDELPVEATLKADVVDSAVDHFPQTDPFQLVVFLFWEGVLGLISWGPCWSRFGGNLLDRP